MVKSARGRTMYSGAFFIKNKQNTPLFYSGDECFQENPLIEKMPRSLCCGVIHSEEAVYCDDCQHARPQIFHACTMRTAAPGGTIKGMSRVVNR